MLEPDEHLAMCLVWQGAREEIGVSEDPSRIEVAWDGHYELLGDFFHVETTNPKIGERAVGDYPLDAVRDVLQKAQSTLAKMTDVLGQWDAIDITDEVVARFLKKGWTEERLLELKAQGYRYSPSRDTLLGQVMNSGDLDDKDEDDDDARSS